MKITRRMLALVLLSGVIVIFACGAPEASPGNISTSEPAASEAPAEPTQAAVLPTAVQLPTAQPALPERRRLTLEFPPRIRIGDSDEVRLMLEVDDLGNLTPTAEVGGHVVTGEVIEIPNLYESHHVIAEARFDIAGMDVRPADLSSEPLSQGNAALFKWSIRPPEVGVYRGTIWLYLRFVDKSSGEESRKTVSAQSVEIEATNFLGLSGNFARMTGIAGSILGTILGFPFLEEILKFIFKRRNR
jgi:hypothetical protein